MRTSKVIIRGAAALICLLGVLSCEKVFTGRAIRFSGRSRQDAPATRAAYSGDVKDGIERIDWEKNDPITMFMKNDDGTESTVYEINQIKENAQFSEANLVPSGSYPDLEWGEGDHEFLAASPSDVVTVSLTDHTFTSTINYSQSQAYITTNSGVAMYENRDQEILLFAGQKVVESGIGNPVTLDFYPMVTTFDFEVGSKTDDDIVIASFYMTTDGAKDDVAVGLRALTGDFTAACDLTRSDATMFSITPVEATVDPVPTEGDDTPAEGEGTVQNNRRIDVNFLTKPAVSLTKKVRFRVMALPQDIQGLTIVFNTEESPANPSSQVPKKMTHTLKLREKVGTGEDWVSFGGRKKYNITGLLIPGGEWKITFAGPRVQQWTVYDEVTIGVE